MEDGIAGRVVRFDSEHQTIAQFLHDWKPSCVPESHIEWLLVSARFADKTQSGVDIEGLLAAWNALCLSSLSRLTTSDIETLAIAHNVRNGKWMYFLDNDIVDAEWSKVALGVLKYGLSLDAKVSTAHVKPLKSGLPKEEKIPPRKHVICIWSENFSNTTDMFELRERLRALGFNDKLYYELDTYSVCGIYQGNSLGLPVANFVLNLCIHLQ